MFNTFKTIKWTFALMSIFSLATGPAISKDYKHFPTDFDGDSLRIAQSKPQEFEDQVYALAGIVNRVENSYWEKPYFRVRLIEENPDSLDLWIAASMNFGEELLTIGSEVRVIGFFVRIDETDKVDTSYNKTGYHFLCFGILNVDLKQGGPDPDYISTFEEWKNGSIDKRKIVGRESKSQ